MGNRTDKNVGQVIRVAGPVVGARNLDGVRLNDVVQVGDLGLVGEVIRISSELTTIQVYEDTSGVSVGEPVRNTGLPLVAWLGPGLLGRTYDGLQRPLTDLVELSGDYVDRGLSAPPLPQATRWSFTPQVAVGESVGPGDVLGVLPETPVIEHRVMVPPGLEGLVVAVYEGEFTVDDTVATIEIKSGTGTKQHDMKLAHRWPVRQPRPVRARLESHEPLITGTRVIDAFFPVAKGGTAIIPGGFGTGKTVMEQSIARWADADVVVCVGCGERGNEMADVLEEFPKITDPYTGLPLMNRTVLIANTSNMPVAAREASIYTGITIAEYYRDMGYDVLMLADSTSRWGEALREISGRLEEIPGEESYPAYLGARLSEFYERSGRVTCLAGTDKDGHGTGSQTRVGSLTLVGAVSPPGGDFSEPIAQSSMRVTGTFWALDYTLSRRRHFPAISWAQSYTLYEFREWYIEHLPEDWDNLIRRAMALLQRADELQEIVQLVGPESLSEAERLLLLTAQMIQEDFLQQSSYDQTDRFSPLEKTYWMLKAILDFHHGSQAALEAGVGLDQLRGLPEVARIARMKELPPDEAAQVLSELCRLMPDTFVELGVDLDVASHPAT